MTEIGYKETFHRTLKRKVRARPQLVARYRSRLEMFVLDPFDLRLKTHKLSGNLSEYWSFSIESDLRVLFYFDSPTRVVFVDFGTHDEVY